MTVVDFLKHGRENAICADVLAAAILHTKTLQTRTE